MRRDLFKYYEQNNLMRSAPHLERKAWSVWVHFKCYLFFAEIKWQIIAWLIREKCEEFHASGHSVSTTSELGYSIFFLILVVARRTFSGGANLRFFCWDLQRRGWNFQGIVQNEKKTKFSRNFPVVSIKKSRNSRKK